MKAIEKIESEQAKAEQTIENLKRMSERYTRLNPWFSATRRCTPGDIYEDQIEDFKRAREERDIVLFIRSSSKIYLPEEYPKPLMRCGAQLFRRLAIAVATADGITELLEWYCLLEKLITTKGPTKIAHYLVQIGVGTASNCECDDYENSANVIDMTFPAVWWQHNNHRLWNTAIHELLTKHDKLQAVRAALLRNQRSHVKDDEHMGPVVHHEYGQLLLDHFLKAKPDVSWIDITVTSNWTPVDSSAA